MFSQALGYVDDIKFKDANNGFMYGDPVGSRWSLWKTTNGGTTWDSTGLYLPQAAAEAGWDNDMCLQGNNIWFGTNAAHIYRSTNFGANWISTSTPGLVQSTSITVSGNTGFVTGSGVSLKTTDAGVTWSAFTNPFTSADIHFQSLGSRFWVAQTNMYYSTNNGSTFPLSYTYAQTTGPMWNIGANVTGTALTVYVTGYAGGIWKYTETVPATPGWTEQTSALAGVVLYSASAVDDNIAWVCGATGKVQRTTNKGVNWVNVSGDMPTTYTLYCIFGYDANIAIATGVAGANTAIFKTINGGTNWVQANVHPGFGDDLWMTDANNAYFIGDPSGGNWDLLKSTNAGSNWSSWSTLPTTNTSGTYNNAACFLGTSVWFPSVGLSTIHYSSNMGVNWSSQPITLSELTAIQFNNATDGLAGGSSTSAGMLKTTNSGTNWTAITSPFATGSISSIVGTGTEYWASLQGTTIQYSSNFGVNWSLSYTSPGGSYYHMSRTRTGSTIWAIRSNGGISRYGLPIVSGITPIVTITPSDYRLEQNYPNPFNPATKITFALPKSGLTTLKIYDITGKVIETLVNSSMNAGTYSYEFNGANLSSGVYFYKLEANGFSAVKKMMLIK